ncbi:Meiosi regulator and mRNA stability factor 1 [Taenia solium]|eukprot:TsM_000736800 transcript=TsM_000736800 gene=TsM_000736800
MKPQAELSQYNKKKDDKNGYMVLSKVQAGNLPKLEDPLCAKHQPRDPRECIQMANQQRMPAVMIGLAELRSNVVRLLQEHNNLLSVMSFTHCYEETFGPLNKAESATEQKHDSDQEKSNKNSVFNNAAAASSITDMPSQGLVVTESLRQFRREVVDLVKQQVGCALPLNKFIPAYHAHFGKQCRVSDYGFARLQDLIEALSGIVHIVGEGPLRTIMLTHVIQVRRFTHDLLRLLKGEQKKCIPISKLPQIYEDVFHKSSSSQYEPMMHKSTAAQEKTLKRYHRNYPLTSIKVHQLAVKWAFFHKYILSNVLKPFMPSNYGVCSILDLLNDVAESKLVVENLEEEGPSVVIPRRIQTAEQKIRTQLFAVEVVDMLSTMQRFQITFTKFIPAYHHAFNHQCRVAEYGFTKFIELLEALPHVVEVQEENGERCVCLTPPLRLAIIRQMLLEILESQILRRLPMSDLVSAFVTHYQLGLLPKDYGFDTLEEMFASFSEVFLTQQQPQRQLETSTSHSITSTSHNPILSMTGDCPKMETTKSEDGKAPNTTIYVCLVDKYKTKQTAYRCLQILFNSPFGSIPEDEFKEHYRSTFQEEVDLDFVHEEMSPFISVKNYNVQMQNPASTGMKPVAPDLDDTEVTVMGSRMVLLCPLILFARQLRFLLMRTRGRLMLNLVEQMYRRHFGVALCPEAYGYPSLLTLVHAVNFVVVVKGRGTRAILFLAQDYLGKLAWNIVYKIPFRHDLINRYITEIVEPKELSQSVVPGKDYLPSTGEMYRPIQRQTTTVPWRYPSCMVQEGQFMQTAMGPARLVPINPFPGDTQQPEYPLAVSGFFVPGPVTQGYTLAQAPATPECTVYDYQGQNQELPPAMNNPLVSYPGIQPSTDLPKLAPTYVSFYITNGETPAQTLPLPGGTVWGQPAEQQLAPAPFYAFPIKPPLPSLPQQAFAYGYTAQQPMNPVPSITQETETVLPSPNQITVPLMPTGTSQEDYLQETAVNEQQGLGEMLALGNDGMQPASNGTSTSYHPIHLSNVAGWLPQSTQQMWTPNLIYQNVQTPLNSPSVDGQVMTPQSGAWMTDYNQWLDACRVATQWPIFQTTPMSVRPPGQPTIPTVDPQSTSNGTVVFNGQLCMGNSFTLKPIPCRTEIGPDASPSVNKCEEGDWTLPISMTTESIDVNSKENDETGSIE